MNRRGARSADRFERCKKSLTRRAPSIILTAFFKLITVRPNLMSGAEQIRKQVADKLIEQRRLIHALLGLRKQLGGSLFVRYADCGKEGCACQKGERHGPYYVLSVRSGSQAGFAYLSARQAGQARKQVQRHREFRDGLKRLRQLNAELVELLRRYRDAMASRSAGTFGIVRRRPVRTEKIIV